MKELARQKLRDIVSGSALVNPIAPCVGRRRASSACVTCSRTRTMRPAWATCAARRLFAPPLKDIKWERAAVPTGPSPHLFPGHKVPEEVKLAQPKVSLLFVSPS